MSPAPPSPIAAPTNGTANIGAEITRAFQEQRAYQKSTRPTSLEERLDRLKRLRAKVDQRHADIQAALYADFRKPPEEVDLTETQFVTAEIDFTVKHLKKWMQPDSVSTPIPLLGTTSKVYYEPKGVALIISPWNYPINLTLAPLVSAIAAGNTAILKPSEYTPNATEVMRGIVRECFDEREVALFSGDKDVAQKLLEQPFDHIFFTGSPAVGKIVMKAAAEHLASVTLELGGKSPTIVDATADVEDAARKIVWGKFANTGQTCIAPDYVYVQEAIAPDLVYAMKRQIRKFYGDTEEERQRSPDYARIVNDGHRERLQRIYEEAAAEGAHVEIGGVADEGDRYIAPTLLTDVPMDSRAMEEEIFGPVLPVLRFGDLDEALATINSKPNPLALYIFSQERTNIDRILERTTAGGTCINDTLLHYLNPELPFGGAGHSGIGRSHGEAGFKAFSNERAVLERKLGSAAMEYLYPPYGATARRIIGLMRRFL